MKLIKRLIAIIGSYFATKLPQGVTEFNEWASSIISLSGLPDNRSTRFSLAAMIMHGSNTMDKKPKRFFIRQLRKAAANEIAHSFLEQYKKEQKAEYEAAIATEAAKQTVPTNVAPIK